MLQLVTTLFFVHTTSNILIYNPKKPLYTVSVFSCYNIFNYSFLFYYSSSHSQRPTSNRGHGSTQRRRLFIQTWRLAQPQLYLTAFKTTYETDLVRERKRSELWLMPDNKTLIWIEIFWVPIIKALKMIRKKVRPKLWKSHIVNGSPCTNVARYYLGRRESRKTLIQMHTLD